MSRDRFRRCLVSPLATVPKLANRPGLQLADLVAYPLAQRLRYPGNESPALAVVWRKLYCSRQGVWGAGLKVFPPARPEEYGLET